MTGWVSFWNWLLLGVAVFLIMGMLSVWSEATDDCAGVVVKNFWGLPVCVDASE